MSEFSRGPLVWETTWSLLLSQPPGQSGEGNNPACCRSFRSLPPSPQQSLHKWSSSKRTRTTHSAIAASRSSMASTLPLQRSVSLAELHSALLTAVGRAAHGSHTVLSNRREKDQPASVLNHIICHQTGGPTWLLGWWVRLEFPEVSDGKHQKRNFDSLWDGRINIATHQHM